MLMAITVKPYVAESRPEHVCAWVVHGLYTQVSLVLFMPMHCCIHVFFPAQDAICITLVGIKLIIIHKLPIRSLGILAGLPCLPPAMRIMLLGCWLSLTSCSALRITTVSYG